jgi:protocatechuate 3,4-dioxygenase, beta subunit
MRSIFSRRGFMGVAALSLSACATGAVRAADLIPTPAQTEGPFYPDKLPLDQDNDLVLVQGHLDPSKGIVTHLHGRILGPDGKPVRGAVMEIWQCDANGIYLHTRGGDRAKMDAGFQGFGRFQVGDDGAYRFRTIRPVAYPGRTPHIHVKIRQGESELLTTQCYVKGEVGNGRDGIFRSLGENGQRLVAVDFTPKDGVANELTATFDVVLGKTPKA